MSLKYFADSETNSFISRHCNVSADIRIYQEQKFSMPNGALYAFLNV